MALGYDVGKISANCLVGKRISECLYPRYIVSISIIEIVLYCQFRCRECRYTGYNKFTYRNINFWIQRLFLISEENDRQKLRDKTGYAEYNIPGVLITIGDLQNGCGSSCGISFKWSDYFQSMAQLSWPTAVLWNLIMPNSCASCLRTFLTSKISHRYRYRDISRISYYWHNIDSQHVTSTHLYYTTTHLSVLQTLHIVIHAKKLCSCLRLLSPTNTTW